MISSKNPINNLLWNTISFLIIGCVFLAECKEFGHAKDVSVSVNFRKDKLKICIVENSSGSFRRTEHYCPIIEKSSDIECVVGIDRLDCARKISKGSAHFGVFTSEDLVGARWASLELLVTTEIRFHKQEFEYDLVVVVDNEANIHTAADLKGSRLCHPGKGLDTSWNDILSDYVENLMIPKSCELELTLTESRIKAASSFFGSSCKAGPWVNDPTIDRQLKLKYPSLCALCYEPNKCAVGDKFWGRRGPLYCLTGGGGEAAYLRLDDVRSFFGLTSSLEGADPDSYSFLCPDGHLQPLSTEFPCTWISKPWPVIASKRSYAEKVQELLRNIDTSLDWQQALLQLLESYHVNISSLDFPITIGDYLDKSSGYQSAHSFAACYPPRQIVFCTTTLIEFAKCSWLQEVSTVYGIEPNIQCIRGESKFRCLDDVANNVADLVVVSQDERLRSELNFNLSPILYEYSARFEDNYVTVAVVKSNSKIQSYKDLYEKRACFPSQEGAAFLSVAQTISRLKLSDTNCTSSVEKFFASDSCYGKINQCSDRYDGDEGALRCLEERADVAFMDMKTFKNLTSKHSSRYRVICPFQDDRSSYVSDLCYLSFTSRGVIMTGRNKTKTRIDEIVNTLKSMDMHFGKRTFRSGNIPFTLYGQFDRQRDVIFRDSTDSLATKFEIVKKRPYDLNLEDHIADLVRNEEKLNCQSNATFYRANSFVISLIALSMLMFSL